MERKPALNGLMPAVEILSEYGTAVRYPAESSSEPSVEVAKEALKLAEQIAGAVAKG